MKTFVQLSVHNRYNLVSGGIVARATKPPTGLSPPAYPAEALQFNRGFASLRAPDTPVADMQSSTSARSFHVV